MRTPLPAPSAVSCASGASPLQVLECEADPDAVSTMGNRSFERFSSHSLLGVVPQFWMSLLVSFAFAGSVAWADTSDAVLASVPHAKKPGATRYAAGTLRAEDIKTLADAGVRHVIDLTTANETPGFNGRELIERAGMTYASLPIDGKDGLTRENVRAFDALLSAAGEDTTLVHCASANRVGALVALRAAWLHGATPQQAIAEGERWGLKGLRDTVAQQLGAEAKEQ